MSEKTFAPAAPAAGPSRLRAAWRSLSGPGMLIGAVFLAASLTPSLIPRSFLLQGALAGACFAFGYGLGVLGRLVWLYLGLPVARASLRRTGTWAAAAIAAAIVLAFVWRAADWQNSIRVLMEMPPVESARPLEVLLIAAAVFAMLILLARLFAVVFRRVERRTGRYVPVRVSRIVAVVVAVILFATVIDGLLFKALLRSADYSFRALDARIEPEVARPADPMATGSAASLLDWRGLGRAGREFIGSGPGREEIGAFLGREALRPIRVYVGLNSADDFETRAKLALDELRRAGGFERSVLVVSVPTGTGWMDPAATDTLEYLHGGDTAIVAVQYSYLSSPLSLLVEPGNSGAQGRALFRAVYGYWKTLPRDRRPRLYLYGLSLGSFGSEQSFRLLDVIGDPFNGALWSGPTFGNPDWQAATREREPGSPEWLPRFGDGSIIRFTNQQNALDNPGARWGPMRIVYLQYASDPITFFSLDSFWRKPDWMNAPVGPDVSPELRWYPVVTFLQLMVDTAVGLGVPIGHGHYYAPQHYIDGWVAVTAPEGWTPAEIDRLKAHFES